MARLHHRRARCCGLPALVALALLLAACAERAAAPPDLRAVPPRPALSEGPAARARDQAALAQDAALLDHRRAQLAYELGQRALPPEPPTLEPLPPADRPEEAAPPSVRPIDPTTAFVAERVRDEVDDGSLGDFMRRLVERYPGPELEPFDPEAVPAAPAVPLPPLAEPPPEPAAAAPERPVQSRALDRFLDRLGPRFERQPTAAAAPPPLAAVPPPLLTAAQRAGEEPALRVIPTAAPRAADARLAELARALLAGQDALTVIGRGATPEAALEQARKVAEAFTAHGVPAERIAVRASGPGEEVLVFLRPRRAS